jgi:hypothetical protein
MSLVDELADTTWSRSEVERLRRLAFEDESLAHRRRAEADRLELDLVERMTAANILREVGLTVDRDEFGVPRVKVERTLAPSPGRTEE